MRLPLARAPLRSASRALCAASPSPLLAPRAALSSSSRVGAPSSSSSPPPPSSSAADAARARKRAQTKQREWTLVGAAGLFTVTGAWYLFAREQSTKAKAKAPAPKHTSNDPAPDVPISFELEVRTPGGQEVRTITALTRQAAEARLKTHETSTTVGRAACVVSRYDNNHLASNDPIEDRHAEAVVRRDPGVSAGDPDKGDLAFFAVMDGHSGTETSELLKHKLIMSVAAELDAVFRASGEYAALAQSKAALPSKAWRALFGAPGGTPTDGLEADPAIVARALSKAFVALDSSITEGPVEVLKQYEAARIAATASGHGSELGERPAPTPGSFASILPSSMRSLSPEAERAAALRRQGYEALLPALSGACALLTYVDSARGDVYVACTGDSRAVAGWYDERYKRWEIEPLSEDQMGRSEKEVQRMRSEHPADERETVISRGRVLGQLEPTRAFGDARYKWARQTMQSLVNAFVPGGERTIRPQPKALQTPPYVTARPEVTWRRVSNSKGRSLRWIVMATDGLWDDIPTNEVGNLMCAHLDGMRGEISATALKAHLAKGSFQAMRAGGDAAAAAEPQQQAPPSRSGEHPIYSRRERQYTFEDGNLATHLIRNALGGAHRDRVESLLAIPAPYSRRFRDDMTVSVILFNDANAADAPAAADEASAPAPKAKL